MFLLGRCHRLHGFAIKCWSKLFKRFCFFFLTQNGWERVSLNQTKRKVRILIEHSLISLSYIDLVKPKSRASDNTDYNAILRQEYRNMSAACWMKIYSCIGLRRFAIPFKTFNTKVYFLPTSSPRKIAVCHVKIAFSFVWTFHNLSIQRTREKLRAKLARSTRGWGGVGRWGVRTKLARTNREAVDIFGKKLTYQTPPPASRSTPWPLN